MSATPSPRSAARGQRGFTLVEVSVAAVILSIFVLGLSALWQASARRVEDLTVRQKAVFVLNAEMERLTALYGHTSFGEDGPVSSNGFDNPLLPSTRLVYPAEVEDWMEDDSDEFVTTSFSTFQNWSEFRVYSTTGWNRRSYVWIDRDRNIAGRLSWREENIVVPWLSCPSMDGCYCRDHDGWGAGYCREIELYLEYPYRPAADGSFSTPSNLQTISLTTVTGRLR